MDRKIKLSKAEMAELNRKIKLSKAELAELNKIKKQQKEELEKLVVEVLKTLSYRQVLDETLLKDVLLRYLETDSDLLVSTYEFSTDVTNNILVGVVCDDISCQCQFSIMK